jgi:2-oxoglutarate ferredoxin oxidoreductase subunit alpha
VIVRFAGDSGRISSPADASHARAVRQLAACRASAEIRPAGSLAGVSSFQIHFAERDIATPGDTPTCWWP